YSDVWAAGILRRAMLEAGRRLAERGRVAEAVHAVDAGADELVALIRGTGGPSAEELAERARFRAWARTKDAPQERGPPAPPPPPMDALPPAARRVNEAMMTVMQHLFGDAEEAATPPRTVRGIGASPGIVEGRARVLAGPDEMDLLEPGDVLVATSTSEGFNQVLPLLAGIVTDSGGLLSHAAIVAREFGIPGVVGCRIATREISDGAIVRIDGERGEVRIL
ncbi:MAG TPA: PEP-utilizing enzyme, partial [Solirubrobacteraceae bacterium]|nr:PEP-utilizing enzyme [Solirubrobacteraceae bacterium]